MNSRIRDGACGVALLVVSWASSVACQSAAGEMPTFIFGLFSLLTLGLSGVFVIRTFFPKAFN